MAWTPDAIRALAARRAGDGPSGPAYDPELLDAMCDAADEIERLRKLAFELADQWASCEAERNPQDFHEFGPCQLMQEGLALRTNK